MSSSAGLDLLTSWAATLRRKGEACQFAQPMLGIGDRCSSGSDIGLGEVVAFEEQRSIKLFRQRIHKTVAVIERGFCAAAFAKALECLQCETRLLGRER